MGTPAACLAASVLVVPDYAVMQVLLAYRAQTHRAVALHQVEAEEIFKIISKVPLTAPKQAFAWAPRHW
jgi:hypothetical protein